MWDLNRQEMALSRHGFSSFNVWYILAFLEDHKDKIVSQMNEEWKYLSHWSSFKILWVKQVSKD